MNISHILFFSLKMVSFGEAKTSGLNTTRPRPHRADAARERLRTKLSNVCVFCLLQNCGIESLVDELCAKLKEIQGEGKGNS